MCRHTDRRVEISGGRETLRRRGRSLGCAGRVREGRESWHPFRFISKDKPALIGSGDEATPHQGSGLTEDLR